MSRNPNVTCQYCKWCAKMTMDVNSCYEIEVFCVKRLLKYSWEDIGKSIVDKYKDSCDKFEPYDGELITFKNLFEAKN